MTTWKTGVELSFLIQLLTVKNVEPNFKFLISKGNFHTSLGSLDLCNIKFYKKKKKKEIQILILLTIQGPGSSFTKIRYEHFDCLNYASYILNFVYIDIIHSIEMFSENQCQKCIWFASHWLYDRSDEKEGIGKLSGNL